MSTYKVRHLETGKEFERPWMLTNPHATTPSSVDREPADPAVEAFHKALPHHNETQLHELKAVASELGLSRLFLKDESTRFGLPAFKILGASWAAHRAICQKLDLPVSASLDEVKTALAKVNAGESKVRLVTASEGNWGRAVSCMAKTYAIEATIYVPGFMSEYTQNLLRGEGAEVVVLKDGSYDDSIAETIKDAASTGNLMLMDTSWEGYETVPKWVTQGYSTMLTETDRQVSALTGGLQPNVLFASVGVGSWAHAVVAHYQAVSPDNKILTVEPNTAASLKESLHQAEITPIVTGDTIMAGMNCGTTSQIAWPVLRDGVHAAVTVTDWESHGCVKELKDKGVNAGPCGAATLAALRKWTGTLGAEERKEMVVVLFSTEGGREYETPPKNE